MYLEKIKNIIQNNFLDKIFIASAIFPAEEDGLPEIILMNSYLFLEFGNQLVKIEAIEQYSKISISEVSSINVNTDLEDVFPAKSDISGLIFDNIYIDNKVRQIELFNMQEYNNEIVCDALELTLISKTNNQVLFLDPQHLV